MATKKSKTEDKVSIEFTHYKDHKNVIQFRASDEDSIITGGVYIAKSHIGKGVKTITLTLEQ